MPTLVQVSDLLPLVLRHIVDLTLLRCFVRVLAAHGKYKVLRLILVPLMQVRELVATAAVLHRSAPFNLVGLLVDHKALIRNDCSDLVFFLLTANKKDAVLGLYSAEIFRHDISVAKVDGSRRLR